MANVKLLPYQSNLLLLLNAVHLVYNFHSDWNA